MDIPAGQFDIDQYLSLDNEDDIHGLNRQRDPPSFLFSAAEDIPAIRIEADDNAGPHSLSEAPYPPSGQIPSLNFEEASPILNPHSRPSLGIHDHSYSSYSSEFGSDLGSELNNALSPALSTTTPIGTPIPFPSAQGASAVSPLALLPTNNDMDLPLDDDFATLDQLAEQIKYPDVDLVNRNQLGIPTRRGDRQRSFSDSWPLEHNQSTQAFLHDGFVKNDQSTLDFYLELEGSLSNATGSQPLSPVTDTFSPLTPTSNNDMLQVPHAHSYGTNGGYDSPASPASGYSVSSANSAYGVSPSPNPIVSTPGSPYLSPHHSGDYSTSSQNSNNLRVQTRPRSHSNPYDFEGHSLASPTSPGGTTVRKRSQKHPSMFTCGLCDKKFTRAYNLRSHMRTHTDERPFVCTVCGKAFARQHDRRRHEDLHTGEKKFVCEGVLGDNTTRWGCGRRFARADALGRHFRTEAGKSCFRPLVLDVRAKRGVNEGVSEGIIYSGDIDGEPQLVLLDLEDVNVSRRAVIVSALTEQLLPDP